MTLTELPPDEATLVEAPDAPAAAPAESAPEPPASAVVPTCLSALLATAAFGWIAGSVFSGWLARGVGLAGAVLGVAVVLLSTRTRRPAVVQYAGAGVAVVVGGLLVLPDAQGGSASLPSLVVEAVRGGGLGLPPVAFDPGWRFLLLVITALLGQATAGLALALDRPRLAAGVALPLVVGGALLQPPGALVGTLVALLLLVAALTVSFGSELAAEGATSGGFELRRLARGAAALAVLGGLLAGTAQLGFLFPESSSDQVVPPQRPQLPPSAPDRVLFTVDADRPLPWRLGTLDVYRDVAWLTPPYDTKRLVELDGDGTVPTDAPQETRGPIRPDRTTTVRFTLADSPGKVLPGLLNPVRVSGDTDISYDPRTQTLRVPGTRPRRGTSYEVVAPAAPTGAELSKAGKPGPAVQEFLAAPPAPAEVVALLQQAPDNAFARLQYVRRAYYAQVVAAGAGNPVDVPPARVVELLQGKEGTPYEITAAEVLLARWAGVPARIGYGYFGGEDRDGVLEVRPKHGATWLEAYFEGHGWVPVVGTPPRARVTLNNDDQKGDPSVRASDGLAVVVYAPVRLRTVRLVYETVRYYAVAALPWVLAAALLAFLFPAAVKALRRLVRRRAARQLGRRAQVAAAYADLRDAATDLAIGTPAMTPIEFAAAVADDAEHRELAWLVTRALWGDLRRDLTAEDVTAAEEMTRSVGRRLRTAQPGFSRLTALSSRASLARPWTRELPALWPEPRERRRVLAVPVKRRRPPLRARVAAVPPRVAGWLRQLPARLHPRRSWPPRPVPVAALAGVVILAAALLIRPGGDDELVRPAGPALPEQVAPERIGAVRFTPEPAAAAAYRGTGRASLTVDGRVFSIREGSVVQGSLQVAGLAPEVDVRNRRVRDKMLAGLGGRFAPARIGDERIFRAELAEQQLLLSFSRDGRSYYLMVARRAFDEADRVFAAVLAFSRGNAAPQTLAPADVPIPDPRRGSAQ